MLRLFLALAALAAGSATADTKTTSVSSYAYDARGRIQTELIKSYGPDAALTSTTDVRYRYDEAAGHLLDQTWTTKSPGGDVISSALTTHSWRDGELVQTERSWMNAAGRQTRREVDTWEKDDSIRLKQRQTDVYDAEDLLVETRYGIHTFDTRGRSLARDESRFDARGLQTGRQLDELRYDTDGRIAGRTIHDFDVHDEITKVVKERWTWGRPAAGGGERLERIDTTVKDGAGRVQETSIDKRAYEGGRMVQRTWSVFDATGEITRQLVESLAYDGAGHLQARRGTWEYFADPR
ncbi:MAG: hypothetical protein AMXMBFR64_47140 [Myxococcales bacterium]